MSRAAVQRQDRVKIRLAVGFGALGAVILAVVVWIPWQTFPNPLLWAPFAAAFVYFEWHSVEVNDRLFASPSVMVLLTAAVVFGPTSAVVGGATMAALAVVTPMDVRERRWFQPIVNFGQLVASATAATTVFSLFVSIGTTPGASVLDAGLWRIAVRSALASIVYGFVNYWMVLFIVSKVYGRLEVRPWSNMAQIMVPDIGM